MMFLAVLSAGLIVSGGVSAAAPGPPQFTRKPSATRTDTAVTITFAVDRETDAAVFIEDAKGNVIRHLVAGVLGDNPPPPLKPNSLEQSVSRLPASRALKVEGSSLVSD